MDYMTYYPMIRAFTRTGQMNQLYDILIQLPQKVVDVTLLGRFIENHDTPRFASQTKDVGLRQSAFVFNVLSDAIPIVWFPNVQAEIGVLWSRDVLIWRT